METNSDMQKKSIEVCDGKPILLFALIISENKMFLIYFHMPINSPANFYCSFYCSANISATFQFAFFFFLSLDLFVLICGRVSSPASITIWDRKSLWEALERHVYVDVYDSLARPLSRRGKVPTSESATLIGTIWTIEFHRQIIIELATR